MHMIFEEEEKVWIDTKKFGWPIKDGCPDDMRKEIERKKAIVNNQMENRYGNSRNTHR